jgi:hypothetical protein
MMQKWGDNHKAYGSTYPISMKARETSKSQHNQKTRQTAEKIKQSMKKK